MNRILLPVLVLVFLAACGQGSPEESNQDLHSRDDFTTSDLDAVPADTLYPGLVTELIVCSFFEHVLFRFQL